MKRLLFFFLLVALSFPQVMRAQNETKPFVHCIVLDKTKSMIGRDGTKKGTTNIWEDVQNYCYGMVDGFAVPSTVVFYTFDKALYGPDVFEIRSEADKDAVKNMVKDIQVDGQYTWISSNLEKVINSVYKEYPDNNIMIYLLTDGIEEQQPCNIQKVVDHYHAFVGDYDHLYYVDLRGLLDDPNNISADAIKKAFDNGNSTTRVKEFTKIVNMSPMLNPVTYEFKDDTYNDREFEITQIFKVTSGKLTDDFSFEAYIPNGSANGLNLDIIPSKLSVKNMNRMDEGKYSVTFKVKIVNNATILTGVIPVSLKGCTGQNTLTIEPSMFNIEITREPEKQIEIHRDTLIKHDTLTKTVFIESKDKPRIIGIKPNPYQKKQTN